MFWLAAPVVSTARTASQNMLFFYYSENLLLSLIVGNL